MDSRSARIPANASGAWRRRGPSYRILQNDPMDQKIAPSLQGVRLYQFRTESARREPEEARGRRKATGFRRPQRPRIQEAPPPRRSTVGSRLLRANEARAVRSIAAA